MKKIAVVLVLFLIVGSVPAWSTCALKNWASEKAQSDSYPTKAAGLLVKGVHEVVEAPFILLWHPYNDVVKEKQYATGLFTGLGKGLYHGVESVGVGAVNIISAPIPGLKGIESDHEKTGEASSATT